MHNRPRRFHLRERTTNSHASVDAAVGILDSLSAYKRYVAGLHAFRLPLERSLDHVEWPAVFAGWRPQRITGPLTSDMADLDMVATGELAVPPAPSGLSALLGTLYVLEGATLGAQLLHRRARALGLTDGFGARHLALQAGGIDSWRQFLVLLEAAEPFEQEHAVGASRAAFRLAEAAFAGGVNA